MEADVVAAVVGTKDAGFVIVPVGDTTVYVDAPEPVIVSVAPEHKEVLLWLKPTVGTILAVTVVATEFVQPAVLVPVTVYVVFTVGETA